MTIITYRDGIMAADSLLVADYVRIGHVRKIARGPDGSLAGVSGDAGAAHRFRLWFAGNGVDTATSFTPDTDNFNGIAVSSDGQRLYVISLRGVFIDIVAPFLCIGGGEYIARGVMAAGGSAELAVKTVIECDMTCGGEVQVERLEGW